MKIKYDELGGMIYFRIEFEESRFYRKQVK